MARPRFARLERNLRLFDVYVISTGAMISSGFFLLPGLAASYTGPSVVLAYVLAGLLVVPALVSQAELATAMPRAGGAYYFLDRTLGPLVGTIGGIGTWLTLVLKSGFALIGMGAYLQLVLDVPILPTTIAVTVVFALLNILGTRESTGMLRGLVIALLTIVGFFIVHGVVDVIASQGSVFPARRFTPFMTNGVDGMLSTIGLVFVSYIGLTNVASLAEEIEDPERNIPLGMVLALATVTTVYAVGVYVMVAVLGVPVLSESLTPVADAASMFTRWLPGSLGLWLMVGAAIAAFVAMANAGILAASRYPLAMARDRLFPDAFSMTGRLGTPVLSILFTCGLLIVFLLLLDVEGVAKLASALQLLIFCLINVAVIVMRESHIESYDPGFRSPLYPWMQLAGVIVPLVLVAEMGWLPVLFSMGVIAACFGWYTYYASSRIEREGALYHVFARLGRRRFEGLEQELRVIMKEKGARAADPFDEVVARALVLDVSEKTPLDDLIRNASIQLASRLPATSMELEESFTRGLQMGGTPVAHGAALLHMKLSDFDASELLVVLCRSGLVVDAAAGEAEQEIAREGAVTPIQAVFFLASGKADPGQHLRILAQIASRVEEEGFLAELLGAADEQKLKEILLRDDRFLSLRIESGRRSEVLDGKALRDLYMPDGTLVALIRRGDESIIPRGGTVLRKGDRLTFIGEPRGVRALSEQFGDGSR